MKTFFIISVFSLVVFGSVHGQVTDSVKFISLPPSEFKLAFQKNDKALLIDVREFFEYRKSRLKGAVNIPSTGNLEFSADTINKEYTLFLYCTTGFRSKRTAKYFYDRGFNRPYSLDGGIVAWKKMHLPIDRSRVRKVASSLRSSQ